MSYGEASSYQGNKKKWGLLKKSKKRFVKCFLLGAQEYPKPETSQISRFAKQHAEYDDDGK